eukprot:sb/3472545/
MSDGGVPMAYFGIFWYIPQHFQRFSIYQSIPKYTKIYQKLKLLAAVLSLTCNMPGPPEIKTEPPGGAVPVVAVPSPVENIDTDLQYFRKFKQYVTLIADPERDDASRFKASQELSEHLEFIVQNTHYAEFLSHLLNEFLHFLEVTTCFYGFNGTLPFHEATENC